MVFGTANLGMPYGRSRWRGVPSKAAAFELLDAAWSVGIRTFDTAEAYELAPERLREWLDARGRARCARVITKVTPAQGSQLAPALDQALRRFEGCEQRTLLSHGPCNGAVWDAFRAAANDHVPLGQSVYGTEEVAAALHLPGVNLVQAPGNVLDDGALRVRGSSAVALDLRSVFLQGLLLEEPEVAECRVPGSGVIAAAVQRIARELGVALAALLLASVRIATRAGDRLVIGAERPRDLEDALGGLSLDKKIAETFATRVRQAVGGTVPTSISDPRKWPKERASSEGHRAGLPRVVAVVQARSGSSRLPRKVLAPVGHKSLVERVVAQVRGSRLVDDVIVATSTEPSDDELARHLEHSGIKVFRGALDDVLARFVGAAEAADGDVIVRITGDCPLTTPDTIDAVTLAFFRSGVDYATNTAPYSRPDGLDVEVMTRAALQRAHAETESGGGPDREHVTPYLRRADWARKLFYVHRDGPDGRGLRWTVDGPEDLEQVRRIWERLDALGSGPHFYEAIMRVAAAVGTVNAGEIVNRGYYKSLFDGASGAKAAPRRLDQTLRLLDRSAQTIPGGAQTYSKSWRQHIRGVSPLFLDRGQGAYVWDVDGNQYVDLIQGLLANILGYAHPDVNRAVAEQCGTGHSFSLPHPKEIELAERLTRLIPCAEMVRFVKNGSDATAAAVRVARAFTGRSHMAVCGYHGCQDWYIGTTSRSAGVPDAVRSLAHPFPYNNLAELEKLLAGRRDEFAAVIMEPYTFYEPDAGYLEGVRELTQRHGALLIFDEICTGFHLGLGGAQRRFGVIPDLATFGKAMGNGYPISCVVGRRDIMQKFEDVFVSYTFGGEVGAMAAALVVLDVLEHTSALDRMEGAGIRLRDGVNAFAQEAGLGDRVRTHGHPRWQLIRFLDTNGQEDEVLRALWLQEVTRRGVLVLSTHNTCAALDETAVEHVLRAYAEAFKYVGSVLKRGDDLRGHLDGPVPTPAFRVRA